MKIDANTLTVGQLVRALEVVHNAPKTPQLSDALNDSNSVRNASPDDPFVDFNDLSKTGGVQMSLHSDLLVFKLEPIVGALPFLNFRFSDGQGVKDLGLVLKSSLRPGHPNNIEVTLRDLTSHDTLLQNITSHTTLAELVSAIKVASLSAMNDQSFNAVEDTAVKFVRAVNGAIVRSNQELKKEREEYINSLSLPMCLANLNEAVQVVKSQEGTLRVGAGSWDTIQNILNEDIPLLQDVNYINAALFAAHNVNPKLPHNDRSRCLNDLVVDDDFFNREIMPRVRGIDTSQRYETKKQAAVELLTSLRNYYIMQGQVSPIIADAA